MSRPRRDSLFPPNELLVDAWKACVKGREAQASPELLALLGEAETASIVSLLQWTAKYLRQQARFERGYHELRSLNEDLVSQIETLSSPPRQMARLFRVDRASSLAYVSVSPSTQLQVGLAKDVDVSALEPGRDVVLNSERSCVLQSIAGADRSTGTMRVLRFKSFVEDEVEAAQAKEDEADQLLPVLALDGDREVIVYVSRRLLAELRSVLETAKEARLYVDDFAMVRRLDAGQEVDSMFAARRFELSLDAIREDEICGLEAQKKEIRAAVARVEEFGAFVLSVGPSGAGKTLLARWVRSLLEEEGEVVVLGQKATQEQRYWRQEEADIQALSDCADRLVRAGKKVLIFLDEIDALFYNSRLGHSVHSNSSRATWLSVMDGGTARRGIFWYGTTNKASHLPNELLTRVSHLLSFEALAREDAHAILGMHIEASVACRPSKAAVIDVAIDMCYDETPDNVVAEVTLRNQDVVELRPKDFHVLSARFFVDLGRSLTQDIRERKNGNPVAIDVATVSRRTHDAVLSRIRGSGLTLENLQDRCFPEFEVRNPPEKIALVEPCAADTQTFLRYEPLELPS